MLLVKFHECLPRFSEFVESVIALKAVSHEEWCDDEWYDDEKSVTAGVQTPTASSSNFWMKPSSLENFDATSRVFSPSSQEMPSQRSGL